VKVRGNTTKMWIRIRIRIRGTGDAELRVTQSRNIQGQKESF
jgi:hypothetical protein